MGKKITENSCSCGETKKDDLHDTIRPPGPCTNDIYRTSGLPLRFMYPKVFEGYRQNDKSLPHPRYRSTSMDYGWYAPTVHTVPANYYPRNNSFSDQLSRAGMYRNCSLNTELDKTLF